MVGVELGNLDKTIDALIKLPLTSIAAKLRSTKSQKELKVTVEWHVHTFKGSATIDFHQNRVGFLI